MPFLLFFIHMTVLNLTGSLFSKILCEGRSSNFFKETSQRKETFFVMYSGVSQVFLNVDRFLILFLLLEINHFTR